jgi:phosphoribosylglycinamide formyltransferase-1
MSGLKTKIAILASGRGSNFDAILKAVKAGKLDAEIVAVLSDQPEAPVLEKARAAGIPALAVPPQVKGPAGRQAHDEQVLQALKSYSPRFLVMAGYMRVVTPVLLEAFRSDRGYTRVVNVHPSLLPAFPGVGSYGQAFRHGAHVAGVTVHLVEEAVDTGPILAQEAFSIRHCTSAEEVEKLGLEIEHQLYPETLAWVLPEKFELVQRRIRVRPN